LGFKTISVTEEVYKMLTTEKNVSAESDTKGVSRVRLKSLAFRYISGNML